MPPGGQIQKSILLKCSTPIHLMIGYKIAIHIYEQEQERWYYDFFQFLDMSLPPGGQIQKSIRLKCCTLIDFTICHKFAIHWACKLWTGIMIFIFFPIFRHIDAPWWPNTEINITEMKYPIHFMICYKIAIHCVCKFWTGPMILGFFPIYRHIDAPWWPNTEINITEMKYPDTFHDLLQDCNSLCM